MIGLFPDLSPGRFEVHQTDSKEAAEEAPATGLLETKAVEQRSEAQQPAKKRMPKQVAQTEEKESPLPIRVRLDIPTSAAPSQRIWRVRR
jgi:hypothetical protein